MLSRASAPCNYVHQSKHDGIVHAIPTVRDAMPKKKNEHALLLDVLYCPNMLAMWGSLALPLGNSRNRPGYSSPQAISRVIKSSAICDNRIPSNQKYRDVQWSRSKWPKTDDRGQVTQDS